MGKFKLTDQRIAFALDVASGKDQLEAFLTHCTKNKNITKRSASALASRLMTRKEMKDLVQKYKDEKANAITTVAAREVAEVFKTMMLTTEELDAFHYAVVQGKVEVEEVVPVYVWEDILDGSGKVIKRIRKPQLLRATRKPNIRERQISVDAIYRRQGNYAPAKLFGAIGGVGDDGELENVERFVLLTDGSKVPL